MFHAFHSQPGTHPPCWAAQCMGVQLHLLSTLLALGNFSTSAGLSAPVIGSLAQYHHVTMTCYDCAQVPGIARCEGGRKRPPCGPVWSRRSCLAAGLIRWSVSTFPTPKKRGRNVCQAAVPCLTVLETLENSSFELSCQCNAAVSGFKPFCIHMMTTNKQMVDQPSSQIQGLQNLCLAKKSRRASCTYWHAHSLKSDLLSSNMTIAIPNRNRTVICKFSSMSSSAFPTAQGFFPHTAWRGRSARQTSPQCMTGRSTGRTKTKSNAWNRKHPQTTKTVVDGWAGYGYWNTTLQDGYGWEPQKDH